ncbi:hypothetical protein UFOVP394_6 [uncultured Caudovirales phage]|uniref:Uncharacterized protein n=1 Tax=uncultured Caudovirales phage TaxID=2100421 RepID=A0A6J7X8Y8_9CAUD|nr:hypothetical protein UFOVP394_6 [uncultured Caudovirales phage]
MAANDSLVLQIKTDKNFDDLRIGFYQASNPSGFKRMQSFAALNAARTMLRPMKQAAPKGDTTRTPGKLQKAVKARGVRFNKPGAVVGIKGGRTGVFYGWFVVEGRGGVRRTKSGAVSVRPVAARPFVSDTVKKGGNIERAMEGFSATTEKFLNDGAFRATILKFKRGNQR